MIDEADMCVQAPSLQTFVSFPLSLCLSLSVSLSPSLSIYLSISIHITYEGNYTSKITRLWQDKLNYREEKKKNTRRKKPSQSTNLFLYSPSLALGLCCCCWVFLGQLTWWWVDVALYQNRKIKKKKRREKKNWKFGCACAYVQNGHPPNLSRQRAPLDRSNRRVSGTRPFCNGTQTRSIQLCQ